jgi:hypothetical protein
MKLRLRSSGAILQISGLLCFSIATVEKGRFRKAQALLRINAWMLLCRISDTRARRWISPLGISQHVPIRILATQVMRARKTRKSSVRADASRSSTKALIYKARKLLHAHAQRGSFAIQAN